MPRCNNVLQTEKDLLQHEIRLNSPEEWHFSTFVHTVKSSKAFGHYPVNCKSEYSLFIVFMWYYLCNRVNHGTSNCWLTRFLHINCKLISCNAMLQYKLLLVLQLEKVWLLWKLRSRITIVVESKYIIRFNTL